MKVLVLGSGGREHALVWKLRQSPRVSKVYCAPGNGGIAAEAECLPADLKNLDSLVNVARRVEPDLTVVGPELPLTLGLVDRFTSQGWKTFGPTAAAAQLESSKSFAKLFMQRHHIPSAPYAICKSREEVRDALPHFHMPVVIKADGLAAGKGVVISKSKDEASAVASEMLSGKMLGEAGLCVVLEECLQGEEVSFLVLCDGDRVAPLVPAQDYKRIGDGDTGPNTGGMGAYSSQALLDAQMQNWIVQHIARPVVEGMQAEGVEYKGILYCGLMLTARGPMVLEFNCRFGDPEAQAILMRLESDLVEALEAAIEGRVSEGDFRWSKDASACVVMASGGYPGTFEAGKKISGLEEVERMEQVKVFHAGTSARDDTYFTAGGRVLDITARASDLKTAVARAYEAVAKIGFEGAHYRKDIAAKAGKR